MKYLFIITFMLFLCSCDGRIGEKTSNSCLERYENDEVVCYVLYTVNADGISCKWKEVK